jgi:hypothetical protein
MPAKVAVVLLSGCISASAFSSAVLFSPMCALPSRCLPGLRSQEKRGLCRPTGFLAQNVHEGKYASAAYAPVHRKPGFFMLCGDSEHKHIAPSASQTGDDGGEGGRGADEYICVTFASRTSKSHRCSENAQGINRHFVTFRLNTIKERKFFTHTHPYPLFRILRRPWMFASDVAALIFIDTVDLSMLYGNPPLDI